MSGGGFVCEREHEARIRVRTPKCDELEDVMCHLVHLAAL